MRTIFALFLTAISAFGAVGSWNGVAFTQWNGIAQTGWNGTSISCAGGGGGGYSVSDNFDSYSNSSSLADAANWDQNAGAWIVYKPAADGKIASNSAGDNLIRYSGWAGTANHYVQATFTLPGGSGSGGTGIAARCATSGAFTGYLLVYDRANIYLYSYNAGSASSIYAQQAKTYVTGNKIRLEVTGTGTATRLTGYEDTGSGWVIITGMNSVNPTQDIDGGVPGVHGWDSAGALTLSLDNWEAGDL